MMFSLPEDIKLEVLLEYLQDEPVRVKMRGLHKRNACHDILGVYPYSGRLEIDVARKGVYDTLPEYLFHPFDRFDQLAGRENKDKFDAAVERLEEEKNNAMDFFAPVDMALLSLRRKVYRSLQPYAQENKVLIDILADRIGEKLIENRFVKQALPFIPHARTIRGDKTLVSLILRKIFSAEGIKLVQTDADTLLIDNNPRYSCSVGGTLGEVYAGNSYYDSLISYDVEFWPGDECGEDLPAFIDEAEQFRSFFSDWFLSVEEEVRIRIVDAATGIVLSWNDPVNYLNYNSNL